MVFFMGQEFSLSGSGDGLDNDFHAKVLEGRGHAFAPVRMTIDRTGMARLRAIEMAWMYSIRNAINSISESQVKSVCGQYDKCHMAVCLPLQAD
jgi:hypothetical protein